jgi:hypothetical protein
MDDLAHVVPQRGRAAPSLNDFLGGGTPSGMPFEQEGREDGKVPEEIKIGPSRFFPIFPFKSGRAFVI